MDIPIGFVIGNSTARMAYYQTNGEAKIASMPSMSGLSSMQNHADRIEGTGRSLSKSYDSLKPGEYVVSFPTSDGYEEHFVGDLAVKYIKSVSTGRGDPNRYGTRRVLALFLALAGIIIKDERANLSVVTCLPADIRKNADIRKALKKVLNGTHQFSLNGTPHTFKIDVVKILSEGVPPLLLEDIGDDEIHAVIDVGEWTTDLFVANGLEDPLTDFCGSIEMGVGNIMDYVDDCFEKRYGRRLETGERKQILTNYIQHKPQKKYNYDEGEIDPTDLTMWIDKGIKLIGGEIIERIAVRWRLEGQKKIASSFKSVHLVGGGAYLLKDIIEKSISKQKIRTYTDPEDRTPLGCAYYSEALVYAKE